MSERLGETKSDSFLSALGRVGSIWLGKGYRHNYAEDDHDILPSGAARESYGEVTAVTNLPPMTDEETAALDASIAAQRQRSQG